MPGERAGPGEHAGPRRLRQLLDAVLTIGSDLDLHATLYRITESAAALVDARYAALGVLNETKTGLVDFVTVGVDDATHKAIGHLPKGLGLLGSLITKAEPIRVADLREHPDSAGFPPHHPPMRSFLGVPIRVRHEVFGNLYLTDKTTSEAFSDIDEELVQGLAVAAGIAIENAHLYEHGRRREKVLAAMQEVATGILAGTDPVESLQLVAHQARVLVDGELATIARSDAGGREMVIEVADGDRVSEILGQRFAASGSVSGAVQSTGETVVLEDASHDPREHQPLIRAGDIGPAIFVALRTEETAFGTLSVARRRGRAPFEPSEIELVESFAAQASVVLEYERSRLQAGRMTLLEDQERIARDLHDTVIQRLFASGLSLQGATRLITDDEARRRVDAAVDDLDVTVRHIRTVIFDLGQQASGPESGLRSRVLGVTREAARVLGSDPHVVFEGAVDSRVPAAAADELLASLREALSNVARHAGASSVEVAVKAGSELTLIVQDNGVGFDPAAGTGGRGLANLRVRAERLGGSLSVGSGAAGGTVLEWCVPLTTG